MVFKKNFDQATDDLRRLPGFDENMHKSNVVDEYIEDSPDGGKMIVYRTKREITDAALRNYNFPLFKR